MASRSFKPASYLASAAQRPSFTRSSSNSSARSDDSIVAAVKSFSVVDEKKKENSHVSSPGTKALLFLLCSRCSGSGVVLLFNDAEEAPLRSTPPHTTEGKRVYRRWVVLRQYSLDRTNASHNV